MDGSYTVENSTAGSGSMWWSATDHTGNTGGYMMVVNASISKTDGTLLNSYTTGPIALQSSSLWRQFGFYFTTPANVSSVTIVMRNNSSGGVPANDIALDDITFRPCGPEVTVWISV